MGSNPEYPQYRWMPPRSWTLGRAAGPPKWIVIHTTEGSEGPRSADDGAAYDQRRTDGTSAHFYVDSNSVVQCVKTTDTAHTAAYHGNLHGIHVEVCGRAGQSAAQWDDATSRATIEQLAGLCRALRGRYPFPLQRLTPAQLKGTDRGYCRHYDISLAWGESTHTDPGSGFPWARLFELIKQGEEESDVNAVDVWKIKYREYVDENANGVRDSRTTADILYAAHAAAVRADRAAQAHTALLRQIAGRPADQILAEIRAQGEQTRTALLAVVREQAPALAAAVVERLDTEVTAAGIGEALAVELAGMLAGATADGQG